MATDFTGTTVTDSFDAFEATVTANLQQQRDRRLVVPISRRLSADLITPVSAFLMLRESGDFHFLLESVEGGEKLARYSFLGRDPFLVVTGRGERVEIQDRRTGEVEFMEVGIFEGLKKVTARYTEVVVPGLPRLTAGGVGFVAYDCIRLIERLPGTAPDPLDLPDACWCFYDTIVAFDHVKHQVVLMACAIVDETTDLKRAFVDARHRIAQIESIMRSAVVPRPDAISLPEGSLESNTSHDQFVAAVERAKRYIVDGDIFQVVISQRFMTPFAGDVFNLYRALRQINPSPYLFFISFDGFDLVGSSPELLVRVEDDVVETMPIAGTRPRGDTPEEDEKLATDLLADPKERAEHLMLVDLGRNDLGRVCRFGTVRVEDYAYIERFSHVMHIVSSVAGKLRDGLTALDALAACFPAGTVSGAPKVRAMEIIDELEPVRRGVYAGAIGYIDFSGNLDTCIAIRTMVVRDGTIYVQAGAGIVADSIPGREYDETINKAQAITQAMLVASRGLL